MYLNIFLNVAERYSGNQVKRNSQPKSISNIISLLSMLAPGVIFAGCIISLGLFNPKFNWIMDYKQLPIELFIIAFFGFAASLGGIGDWLFHRYFVAVGPKEHSSHLLALCSGGLPLFILMLLASAATNPNKFLIPIIACVLYTSVLICYDEFVFHLRRCQTFETLMHRLLVFGNLFAWLAWMHWIYVTRVL